MKKTLRLVITYECNKNCKGCCNKQPLHRSNKILLFDWDFTNYDEVVITGGEPMLKKPLVEAIGYLISILRGYPNYPSKLILYTADCSNVPFLIRLMYTYTGLTVTLHEQSDVYNFLYLNYALLRVKRFLQDNNRTLRLNVFKNVEIPGSVDLSLWKIKYNMEWILNCPLPANETIRRLPGT